MPKLDFSSLKTADLRSVAPVDESAMPRVPVQDVSASLSDQEGAVSAPVPAPISIPVVETASAPAIQQASVAPSAPAQHQTHSSHAPVSKRISLTSLKAGGPSAMPKAVPAPAPVVEAVPAEIQPAPASAAISAEAVSHTPKAGQISLTTHPKRPGLNLSLGKKPEEGQSSSESEIAQQDVQKSESAPKAYAEMRELPAHAPVEGVDIIDAAKVVGTEGQTLANEILSEALSDPEEAKKKAEEAALEAVVIPESAKEFFPNLEMDDDFFKDPLFEGIVPEKPDKKPEVRLPLEMKTAEKEAVAAVPETETIAEGEGVPAVAETQEETTATEELPVEVPAETDAASEKPLIAEEETVVAEASVEAVAEAPATEVEAVAKELSAERKGGLSKLFGERKILVRSLAGFLVLAVIGVGAFSFGSPSLKISGPEATGQNTGSEVPAIAPFVPTGETRVISDNVRVYTGRRPNAHKTKKTNPVTHSGATASGAISSGATASGVVNPSMGMGSAMPMAGSGSKLPMPSGTASGTPLPTASSGAVQAPVTASGAKPAAAKPVAPTTKAKPSVKTKK